MTDIMVGVSPWWMGLTTDHIYEHCPARLRSLPQLEGHIGTGALDPEAGDVCGWCLRVWRAREGR